MRACWKDELLNHNGKIVPDLFWTPGCRYAHAKSGKRYNVLELYKNHSQTLYRRNDAHVFRTDMKLFFHCCSMNHWQWFIFSTRPHATRLNNISRFSSGLTEIVRFRGVIQNCTNVRGPSTLTPLCFRGKLLALREFIKEGFRPPAILFTETKERCQRIMGELLYDGINAMSLCAAKSPAERQKVIQATRLGSD